MNDFFIDYSRSNVYGFYGNLGGGKSLSAVAWMVDFLELGFTVVSNISLFNIDKLPGKYIRVPDFSTVDFWGLPCGAPRGSKSPYRVLICIDEAAEFLDQYQSSSPIKKSFLSWLRHSSKRGQFVCLIVQREEYLVKDARILVSRWVRCDDMATLSLPILRIKNPLWHDYVRRIVFDKDHRLVSRGLNLVSKTKYGRYYNTAETLSTHSSDYLQYEYTPPVPSATGYFLILYIIWAISRFYFLC